MIHRLIKPRRPRLLLQTLAVALIAAAVAQAVGATPWGRWVEGRTIDARFSERGSLKPPAEVMVVALDRTQDTYANQWPLSREVYAMAISNLSQAGVAAVGIDVPFNYDAANPTTEDQRFVTALRDSKVPVVVAQRPHGDRASGSLPAPLDAVKGADAALGEPHVSSGVSARIGGDDGVVRSYPNLAAWQPTGDRVPGLATALASAAGAGDAARRVPRNMQLNYYGKAGSFTTISFADVAYGLTTLRDLQGAIVIIGPTEGIGRDDHRVPIGDIMPSVEIQANALANILDDSWLRTTPTWLDTAVAIALAVAIWSMLLALPLGLAVPASIALICGWAWAAIELFERGLLVPMLTPLLAGMLAFGALALVLATLSVRERLRIKGLFARYVSPEIVQELVERDDRIELGGEEREVTVLFSDIRGFTTLSERVEAREMVEQLNEYFAAMVLAVAEQRGTLDKFLGDGMMAIFGAPGDQADHAARACSAALTMLRLLDEVNADRAERGLAELRIGIGIHTGRAVVGNIGSPIFRVDFTAIGDTVNLASRLESSTKELGVEVIVSGATAQAAGESHNFRPKGSLVMRGRTEPTDLFELVAVANPELRVTASGA